MSTATIEKPKVTESISLSGTPSAPPKSMSTKDRLKAAMKRFEKEGVSAIADLPADIFVQAKFPSEVKPPKGWELGLAGKKAGEVSCQLAVETAGMAILDKRQATVPLATENKVRLSVSASRDNTFTEEAAEQIAGKFATECGYGVS